MFSWQSLDIKTGAALLLATVLAITHVAVLSRRPRLQWKTKSHAAIQEKLFWKSSELGVQHFILPGELASGYRVNLHLWLTAHASENDTIRLRGFGLFEPLDYIFFNPSIGQIMMPPMALNELKEPGMLFLEMPSDQAQLPFNVTTGFSPTIPFYLESSLHRSQVEPRAILRVGKWRRYLTFSLRDMIAKSPASCSGHHRVAVWVPPGRAPATVARLLTWHTRYHEALGFSCEIAYVYQDQLEVALEDAEIMQLVQRSQLWLVVVDDFLPGYTWSSGNGASGIERNFVDISDRGTAVNYTDQMVVNVHSVLASSGQDTWLLSVDLDEYLVLSHEGNVQTLFTDCFTRTTALIPRLPATCSTGFSAGSDIPLWMEASGQHPLANYNMHYPNSNDIKSLLRPDDVVSFGVHLAALRQGEQLPTQVAADCGILLLHVEDLYSKRYSGGGEGNITDWKWVLERI